MQVRKPTVGPIVGSTGPTSIRIFIRGELVLADGYPRRAHGVAQLRPMGGQFGAVRYFKLNPNFDLTGVVIFEHLAPDTAYEYRVGWVFSDVDTKEINVSKLLTWDDITPMRVTSASATDTRERSFVMGSCRYLLRFLGGTFFDDRGDKTFGSVLRQIDAGRRTDALLMVGDQIYADDLNVVKADTRIDEFFERYRAAFTTRCIRQLMARVPTYMTLDDHEIEDNWPSHASAKDHVSKFPAAIHAYQTYQLSHSPLLPVRDGKLDGTPDSLWYTFRDGCADFFMADTRTERILQGDERCMIGPVQEAALKSWLGDGSGRIKFVGSSVPLFSATGEDKWEGFIQQRDELLEFIRTRKVPRVVFLSGDVHASFSAELGCDDPDFKLISIVSSAFFWPYPHPLRGTFATQGPIQSNAGNYRITQCSAIHTDDNFCRVTCDPSGLTVEVFARKGQLLGTRQHTF